MKRNFQFLLSAGALVATLFINSCSDDPNDPNQDPNGTADVFLAGREGPGLTDPLVVWKNAVKTILPSDFGGEANSMYTVSGAQVLVAGKTWLDNATTRSVPCYWKDETRVDLTPLNPEKGTGMANGIFRRSSNEFIVGTCSDSLAFANDPFHSGWTYLPCYWKNGEIELLERLDNFGGGFAEAIDGLEDEISNDVYPCIVGSSYAPSGYYEPCYWLPGAYGTPEAAKICRPLSELGYGGTATAVDIVLHPQFQGLASNSDIFIAGYVYDAEGLNIPCYWYNGDLEELSRISNFEHGIARAIEFAGADAATGTIYVAGDTRNEEGESIPCYWKNGVRTDLTGLNGATITGRATAIEVSEGDVYVSGTIMGPSGESPCYWKNDVITIFNQPGVANTMSIVRN